MRKKQKQSTKRHLPQILQQPIVIHAFEERRFRDELAHEMGQRLVAVCQYFGVSASEVDLQGATGTLVLRMAEQCFADSFRVVSVSKAEPIKTRKHLWTSPRKRALIALVEEYRSNGHSSIKKAIAAIQERYKAVHSDSNYLRCASVDSLAARYSEFRAWAANKTEEEPGLPLNPDGAINFRALAQHFLQMQDRYENHRH